MCRFVSGSSFICSTKQNAEYLHKSGRMIRGHANGQYDFGWLPARAMRHTPMWALSTSGA